MKSVYIVTLGCKLNQFESEALAENLRGSGFDIAPSMESSDTVVVNTCTVTNQADARSRQILRKAKRMGKYAVATGCYATSDYDAIAHSDFADLVIGNNNKFKLAEFLGGIVLPGGDADFPSVASFERTRAYIKIQDGCGKYCSYCKIPFARGKSRSLAPEKIVSAMNRLLANGYNEIVLTGVNISDYRYDGETLASLTGKLLDIHGDFRIRLSSLQPDEFEPRLAEYLGHPSFANHFHLSLQSGCDTVLRRMNRHYTGRDFLSLTSLIRAKSPDCGITTDIIVGFPGETESEFDETIALVKEAEFTRVHIFPYSPRSGTCAAGMKDVHGDIKSARERILRETYLDYAGKFVKRHVIGKTQKVLVEKAEKGMAEGYTSNYLRAVFPYHGETNRFAEVSPESYSIAKDWSIDLACL
ncbi:MAG: tRNA (N(6)-L-threonylcarbamoyladenosine(37)-C(2))-methylthiotransferase MtaB [Spirochaetes bacterium GWF1_51_8]|nr:MAG: tRNA (N(6)-L-threonylcarbamoyladenosine(37)-C(2))-methylthiotransferase MtaB [Spirochaetes bacterium GWF1_51_8]